MNAQHLNRIQQIFPCFSSIPNAHWTDADLLVIDSSTPHSIQEGHLLQHTMFIVSGTIRIYKICPNSGREITLYRVNGGQCCSLMLASVLGETEYEASVSVETPTEVLVLPVPTFNSWMDAFKPVKRFVYQEMASRIIDVTTLLEQVAFQSIPTRLSDYLLSRFDGPQADTLFITHEQIAIELGTAREVITRTLKSFAKAEAITLNRGQIVLLDRNALRALSNR
ncbi:Crp/Fnr family transcriptional regulator [Cohnella mopanensis]|uniref:Crp/Fnr family transcriptional regulator n=1 Tax=Cohnella mopanensis TaxID=2911966 RepID=UPI001EF7D473|nr:Crp/Fnr family transcriptional regulator [Cohnella mopanensis]